MSPISRTSPAASADTERNTRSGRESRYWLFGFIYSRRSSVVSKVSRLGFPRPGVDLNSGFGRPQCSDTLFGDTGPFEIYLAQTREGSERPNGIVVYPVAALELELFQLRQRLHLFKPACRDAHVAHLSEPGPLESYTDRSTRKAQFAQIL